MSSILALALLVVSSNDLLTYHVRNAGKVEKVSYVWAYTPDGRAYLPVINGNLPSITTYKYEDGRVAFLDCDYSRSYKYDPAYKGVVNYRISQRSEMHQEKRPKQPDMPGMLRPSELRKIEDSKVKLPKY